MDQYLEVFIAVVEKGNFSRAAEELHMTQPAVSQYIQALEREIGVRLLERSNRYVRMNQMGEIVYHHAKEILGLYTKMQRLVDDAANHASGPVAIGASYTYGEYVLPQVLVEMLAQYPLIVPAVSIGNTKEIVDLVRSHQIDVGVVEGEFTGGQLEVEEFAEDEMVVVMAPGHPLAREKVPLTALQMSQAVWIVREDGSGTRSALEQYHALTGIEGVKKLEFGSTQLVKASVEAGLGITLLSRWAVEKEIKRGLLHSAEAAGLPFKRKFFLVTLSPYKTKALATFIEYVRSRKEFLPQ